ncbi:hypothetical protein [Sulfitobacter sp. W074]|uniref:hypothetical protein n=1 Tax=Sulfitobacter sp. W074 TaxID=2867026 RepID=UPI0021A25DA8|nr:hypothetical protein [Sulfitobacter sp. W074]UWR38377.1 hypothetical protein K3762_04920 [Sulfitobacter sp. W074]
MTYADVKLNSHARSAIFRITHPERKFWKHQVVTLDDRVPDEWKSEEDWAEYDPRD